MKFSCTLTAIALTSLHSMSADTDYSSGIPEFEAAVQKEISDYGIGGIAVALTDGQRLVHAAGYGEAEPDTAGERQ